MDIEHFIRFVVIIFAVSLFLVSAFLYFQRATGPATSAMSFVFLLVVVLTVSNYKRIKGFGFEAEMWDEKQAQAAKLVDRLELLSRASSKQTALIASKIGLWDSGLSNPETAELLDTTRQILQTTGTTDTERKNVLSLLYRRVALNYVNAATRTVERAVQSDRLTSATAFQKASAQDQPQWKEKLTTIDAAISRLREIKVVDMTERRSIQPLQTLVRETDFLVQQAELVKSLDEIEADMSYFETNGQLRRSIDWSFLWK